MNRQQRIDVINQYDVNNEKNLARRLMENILQKDRRTLVLIIQIKAGGVGLEFIEIYRRIYSFS